MTTDRPLDPDLLRRRRRRRLAQGAAALALVAGTLTLLPGWLSPTVHRREIRLARVTSGPLEATVLASGTVVPTSEQVLPTPLGARVVRVLRQPGDALVAGTPIVTLDDTTARLERDRLEQRVASKANEELQLTLAAEHDAADLAARQESQQLDVERLALRLVQRQKLATEGLVSSEALLEAEVESKKAAIELRQTGEAISAGARAAAARHQALAIEKRLLERERDEAAARLAGATVTADRPGILTWVLEQEGITLQAGEAVARVADLSSFRVEASMSDIHAANLAVGQRARVVVDGESLDGQVSTIDPTISNGALRFEVSLAQPAHPKLRFNLRVDVLVVTAERPNVLSLARGPGIRGASQDVYVVQGDHAVRRAVRFGIAGYDQIEVLDGLAAGDEVIVSDLGDSFTSRQIRVRP